MDEFEVGKAPWEVEQTVPQASPQAALTPPQEAFAVGSAPWEVSAQADAGQSEPEKLPEVDFMSKVKLAAFGRSEKDKIKILEEDYGKGNVKRTQEGLLLVKDGSEWKNAETDFLSSVIAATPEMAGGTIGAIKGAALGAPFGPVGMFVGGVLGSSVGSAITTALKDQGARAVGITTQMDAEEALELYANEFAENVMWDAALGGSGRVLKQVSPGLKKIASGVSQRVRGVQVTPTTTPQEKWAAAEFLSTITGKEATDYMAVMRTPEAAEKYLQRSQQMNAWRKSGESVRGLDPATENIATKMKETLTAAKGRAELRWKQDDEILLKSGAFDIKEDVMDVMAETKMVLGSLGVLTKDEKTGALRVAKSLGENNQVSQILDPKSLNALDDVLQTLNNVIPGAKRLESAAGGLTGTTPLPEGKISVGEVRKLVRMIDGVMDSQGMFAGGDLQIAEKAKRALASIRSKLLDKVDKGLSQTTIEGKPGNVFAREARERYSAYRQVYDVFSPKHMAGGNDPVKITQMVEKMTGEKGMSLENAFNNLSKATGDGKAMIEAFEDMQLWKAARNLTERTKQRGVGAAVRDILPWSSSAGQADYIAQRAMKRATPVSSNLDGQLRSMAGFVQEWGKVGVGNSAKALSNPAVQRELLMIMSGKGFSDTYDHTKQQLGLQ